SWGPGRPWWRCRRWSAWAAMSSSRRPAGSAGRRAITIRSERGSAGVWVLALSGVILLSGAASVLAGMAIISRHEAGTAADLAALAAASRALSGPEVACAAGQDIADANGAELVSCTLSADGVVDVTVTVTVQFGSLGLGVARADARAGHAGTGGPAGPAARRVRINHWSTDSRPGHRREVAASSTKLDCAAPG
ncbi:MAG: flp pilus-assembly TadE/G-like family protein, partial [Actinomycetota bacterium]|nr:flp pilus-assembly TadE/G-like family protein [Actinomycetota bacterium]